MRKRILEDIIFSEDVYHCKTILTTGPDGLLLSGPVCTEEPGLGRDYSDHVDDSNPAEYSLEFYYR